MPNCKKPRIVFPFVEAGLGHIMPMTAIADAFEKRYGDRAEVVRTYFYQDKKVESMMSVEADLVRQVKLQNKHKTRARAQFALLRACGTKISLKFLMEARYKRAFLPSLKYLEELKPDIIFNTHFTTLYCACTAKRRGLINSKIVAYCPDPVIGRQWDTRADLIGISSAAGKAKAERGAHFKKTQIVETPFLLRKEVCLFDKGKQFYRNRLGLPENNFTVLLADGAYGAGKLKKTVYALLKSDLKFTVIAVCGKNEGLYREFLNIRPPENITFAPFGFTDKTLELAAACDLFIGKAGASNLAEPIYFGSPAIVTFRATPIEKWICAHFEKNGCAIREENIKRAVRLTETFIKNPALMNKYKDACAHQHRCDGPEIFADILWDSVKDS